MLTLTQLIASTVLLFNYLGSPQGTGIKGDCVKALKVEAKALKYPLTQQEIDSALFIIHKESRFNPNMKNKKSSSHGLNGFLRGTWKNMTSRHGVRHSLAVGPQMKALLIYCYNRYGSLYKAAMHHRRKGWY